MPVRRELAITAAAVAAAGALVGGGGRGTQRLHREPGRLHRVLERRPRGGAGRRATTPGGHAHTEVTGTELAKVNRRGRRLKDAAVTVQRVQKDPDGSYDVIGTC